MKHFYIILAGAFGGAFASWALVSMGAPIYVGWLAACVVGFVIGFKFS